jgi:hypothetical protein
MINIDEEENKYVENVFEIKLTSSCVPSSGCSGCSTASGCRI